MEELPREMEEFRLEMEELPREMEEFHIPSGRRTFRLRPDITISFPLQTKKDMPPVADARL